MTMTDEARQARNEYYREWREKNREKVKAAQARYWERRAQAQPRQHRSAYCKGCGDQLDSDFNESCERCGWLLCDCGDCGCS